MDKITLTAEAIKFIRDGGGAALIAENRAVSAG